MVVYLHARSTGIGSFEHTVCGDEVEVCLMRSRYVLLILFVATLKVASVFGQGIPVSFTLPEAGYLTLVIDGNDGARIRNLIQNTYFTAGEHTIYWDGYDEGAAGSWTGGSYEVKRNLVQPGTYRVRGLLHQGIDLIYEFSVQSPGDPAWHTLNGKGGWLADHSPAIDVLALPAGTYHKSTPVLQVVAPLAETGHGLIYLNEEGVKLQGVSHINNNNDFPTVSTRDLGPARGTDYLSWHAVHRGGSIKLVYAMSSNGKVSPNQFSTGIRTEAIHGIAAHNNQVAINYEGGIVFIDASRARDKTYQIIRTVDVPDVRGIATDGTYLYVIEGTSIRRYNVDYAEGKISNPVTVTTANLDDPQRIKLIDGELYVSDHGKSHQVKVFNLSGSLLRTIGLPGGPQVGLYDERRMSHPMGFDVDGQGKLWVAEYAYMPKRISRWDAKTGAFEKAWYGPPKYGGGLVIDPEDMTRAYYSGQVTGTIEFALNWSTGENKPKRILLNRELRGFSLPVTRKGTDSPIRVQVVNGRRYLFTPAWSQSHASIYSDISIFVVRGDTAAWVAQVGATEEWEKVFNNPKDYPEIYSYVQSNFPKSSPVFIWSDVDGDGDVSLDEIGFHDMPSSKNERYYLDANLNIHLSGGSFLPLDRIDSRGVPIYDMNKFQEKHYVKSGILGQIAFGAGTLITTHGPIEGYVNGKRQWLYHAQWPRRAPGSPLSRFEGDLLETTRILGEPVKPARGESGAVWALNSDLGEVYLFTADGLYVATLFADDRVAPRWMHPQGVIGRGDPIGKVSPYDEHFWPFMTRGTDGEIYITAGKSHTSILRVDGLQNVKRLNIGTITLPGGFKPATGETGGGTSEKSSAVAKVTASSHDGNVPANTLDGDLSTRWSASGKGEWIQYELSQPVTLSKIGIAWHDGNKRSTSFDLMVSNDGSSWTKVLSGKSSGKTLAIETYSFTSTSAKFVRIVGYGNTKNLWNSITEVQLPTGSAAGKAALAEGEEEVIPETFALEQNYPNPFNPSTNIVYHLPERAEVTLHIYNVAGQLVRTLVSGTEQSAGIYQVTWDGRDAGGRPVASGLYLYRIQAGDFQETRRMMLVK